jgi:hypothetical protein
MGSISMDNGCMGNIVDMPGTSRTSCLSYLVLSDVHSIYMDPKAFRIALSALKQVPQSRRRVILNGDILDFEFLYEKSTTFTEKLKAKDWDFFAEEIEKEVIWYLQFEEAILEVVGSRDYIYYIEGNHEQRLRRPKFNSKIPHSYRHWTDLSALIGFEDRLWVPYKDWLAVTPDMLITHGHYCGANPLRKHYMEAKKSLLIGHTHEEGVVSFKTLGSTDKAYNNPCLCELEAPYLENGNTNWSQGFSMIHVYNGVAHTTTYSINDGVCVFGPGTVLQ